MRVSWLPPLLRTKDPVRESQDEADDQAEVAASEEIAASDPLAPDGEAASLDQPQASADSLAAE